MIESSTNIGITNPYCSINKPTEKMLKLGKQLILKEFPNVLLEFNFMDIFGYDTTSGHTVEIEVKCSDYDFHKEFTKPCKIRKHNQYRRNRYKKNKFCPRRFYIMVPTNLEHRALKRIKETEWYKNYGLIVFDINTNNLRIVKKSNILSRNVFKGVLPSMPYGSDKHRKRISV